MIFLNLFNKTKLTKKHKAFLGINVARSFKARYPNEVLNKVKIKEDNESFEVYDYPKEFLLNGNTSKLIKKLIPQDQLVDH